MDNTDRLMTLRNTLTTQLVQVKQRMQEKHTKLNAAIHLEQKQCNFIKALCEDTVVYTPGLPVNLIDFKANLDKKEKELQLELQTKVAKYNARLAEFEVHDFKRQSVQKARLSDLRNELYCCQETWYNEKQRTSAIYKQELNELLNKIRQLKAEGMQLKCEQQHVLLSGSERLTNEGNESVRDIRHELLEVEDELKNSNRIALAIQPEEILQNETEVGTDVVNITAVNLRNEVEVPDWDPTPSQITLPRNHELPQTSRDPVRYSVSSEPAPFLPLREKCLDGDWDVDDYGKHQQSLLYRIRDPHPLSKASHTSKNDEGFATLMNIRPETCAKQIVVKERQERVVTRSRKRKLLNDSMLENLVPDASQ